MKEQWITAVLTILLVGTSVMAESSCAHSGCQKYGFSRPHIKAYFPQKCFDYLNKR